MSDEEKVKLDKLEEKVIQLETKRLDEKVEGVDKRLNLKIDERTTQVKTVFKIIAWIIPLILVVMGYGSYEFIQRKVKEEIASKTEKEIAELRSKLDEVEKTLGKAKKLTSDLETRYKKVAGLEAILPDDAKPEAKKNIDALVKTIKQKPLSELTADDYFWLGYQAEKETKHEEAVFYYRHALELNFAKPYIIHNNLGFAYIDLNRYSEAVKELKDALRLKPDFPNAHKGLGDAYDKLNKDKEAVKEYKEALRLKPDFFKAHNNLGTVYSSLKRYDEAIKEYQEALQLKPDNPEPHYNLALVYAVQGQTDKALLFLDKAIRHGLDNLAHLKTAKELNSIRNKKKFKELIKKAEEQQKKH